MCDLQTHTHGMARSIVPFIVGGDRKRQDNKPDNTLSEVIFPQISMHFRHCHLQMAVRSLSIHLSLMKTSSGYGSAPETEIIASTMIQIVN